MRFKIPPIIYNGQGVSSHAGRHFSDTILVFQRTKIQLAAKDPSPFVVHDWRNDVETIGHVPSEMVRPIVKVA